MTGWEVIVGDSLEVLAGLEAESVDAIVTDPPYGLEFMGREWDRFREDDPGTTRHRGDRAGEHGRIEPDERREGAGGVRVEYGGGKRPSTSRCTGCGKRDQFRKPHECAAGARWARELIDPFAAPPSALAFQSWCREWARLALRALRPGGYLIAFGGTRTYHRMAAGVEDAGFEVRDQLQWLYGQGFPKSLDVSKAIDAAAGAARERGPRVGGALNAGTANGWSGSAPDSETAPLSGTQQVGPPITPDAERWQGWGTALKPAHEPIVLARKPLAGTVAANVLAHGTGALNVDGCRIGLPEGDSVRWNETKSPAGNKAEGWERPWMSDPEEYDRRARQSLEAANTLGRWPANVVLDPEAAAMLDAQTGELGRAGGRPPRRNVGDDGRIAYGDGWHGADAGGVAGPLDAGGSASRFYYCAKASTAERNALDLAYLPRARSPRKRRHQDLAGSWRPRARNRHPTVKPVELMRWLVRLVTPPGGLVVDPFTGSGTTGCAAMLEGARFLGIERDRESALVACARIAWWARHPDGMALVRRLEAEADRGAVTAAGQLDLFAPQPVGESAA